MKNPIVIFTSIVAAAAVVLGTAIYVNKQTAVPKANLAPVVSAKPPEVVVTPAKAPVVAPAVLPAFDTVRVENSGEALIAGRAEPQSEVAIKWNGTVVGTATANAEGSFVVIPTKALSAGTGTITLEVSKNGKTTTSESSVFVVVKKDAPAMVAKIDPTAPTQVVQTPGSPANSKDVQVSAVDYDQAGNIVFSGLAVPGSVVRFYVDNVLTGEGKADANGKWSFAGTSAISPGTHMLRADAVNEAGKVLDRMEQPFVRENTTKVAMAQPATLPLAPPVTTPNAGTQSAVTPAPAAVQENPQRLVIQPGNSLWKLSREVYGKGRMFTIIYAANRDQLKNPNKIFPGQILSAPKQN